MFDKTLKLSLGKIQCSEYKQICEEFEQDFFFSFLILYSLSFLLTFVFPTNEFDH